MKMKRIWITWLLLAGPAWAAWAAEPKAIATSRESFAANSIAFVDASASTSDQPLIWQVVGHPDQPMLTGDPAGIDPANRKGSYGMFPALPPGRYFVAVICTGTVPGKADPQVAVTVVSFVVGDEPAPAPAPPSPTPPSPEPVTPSPRPPLPDPDSLLRSLGQTYGKAQLRTYADTWIESATMLAAGSKRNDIMANFADRWQARRAPEFAPAAKAMASIAPDAFEPTGAARDKLAQAWRQFAWGLLEMAR